MSADTTPRPPSGPIQSGSTTDEASDVRGVEPPPHESPRAMRELSGPVPRVVVHGRGVRQVSHGLPAATGMSDAPEVEVSAALHERPGQPPWARMALALAVAGPALWLGGVPVVVVPVFLGCVTILWLRLCARSPVPLRVPYGTAIGLFAVVITLLQWLPLPDVIREWLAPELSAMTAKAVADSGIVPWSGLSPVPGDTGLEATRLLGLTALFIAAAQLSWRVSAALVAGIGSLVALIGMVQAGLGIRRIFGFYRPADVDLSQTPGLLTTFVNPNHQAGLLLLGIFCAAALAVYYRLERQKTRDGRHLGRTGERSIVALAAVMLQGVALVLSLSRGAIAALLLVTPLALMLAWARESKVSALKLWLRRLALLASVVALGVFVAVRSGAWAELKTLAVASETGFETKFRVAQDALQLTSLSPVLGVGRGAFIDVFPAIDTRPVGILHTHLESAPVAMWVEWGPVAGCVIALGLLWWWIAAVYSSGGRHGRPRRIALCGPLALAIHNLGDFSLEFLGVAAPLCALAGSLSERRMIWRWSTKRAAQLGGLVLVASMVVAVWMLPHTWQRRTHPDDAASSPVTVSALRMRPLDATLHTSLAHQAMVAERWEEARARARVASTLHPHTAEPWWLLSAAELALARPEASAVALARALAAVRAPLSREVVDTLLARYPSADELAMLMPEALVPWQLVMESIIPVAPTYAAILAAARSQVDGQEPEVLRMQVHIALISENPVLARHHARLLVQRAPEQASSYVFLVAALRSFTVPREAELQAAVEAALAHPTWFTAADRGLLEEALVASLLRTGSATTRARARALIPQLLERPGDRAALQRREALRQAASDTP